MPDKPRWENVGATAVLIDERDKKGTVKRSVRVEPGAIYVGEVPRALYRNGSMRRTRKKPKA